MRPEVCLRWIMVVACLVAGVAATVSLLGSGRDEAGGSAPASVSVGEAVERTLAAGSVRVHATMAPGPASAGPAIEVDGVTSLDDTRTRVTARYADSAGDPGAAALEAEVRVTPAGTWLRSAPSAEWAQVSPGVAGQATVTRGWGDLLRGLRAAGPTGRSPLAATHGGRPARVWLDSSGRIGRLELDDPDRPLDLRFHDFGVAVDVSPPPGASPPIDTGP